MSASSIDGLHRITVKKEPPIATKKKVAPGKPTVALSNKGKLGIFKALRYIAIVCLVIFLAVVAWFIYNMYPVDKNDTAPREVTIVSGLSHVDVANQLKSANLIRNAWAFDLYSRVTRSKVIPGVYELTASNSATTIVSKLNYGDYKTVKITLIEGWRATDIESYLMNKAGLTQMKGFATLASPDEGKLFPDTYVVPANITQSEMLKLLMDNYANRTKGLTVSTQSLIIASIVERESGNSDSDRSAIASVLLNRLKVDMPLQVDSSVQYALNSWKPITASDITNVDSPYNTYEHKGLPPGPISNPGLASIKATLSPDNGTYLYFFYANGQIYISNTYQEQVAKIAKYLK